MREYDLISTEAAAKYAAPIYVQTAGARMPDEMFRCMVSDDATDWAAGEKFDQIVKRFQVGSDDKAAGGIGAAAAEAARVVRVAEDDEQLPTRVPNIFVQPGADKSGRIKLALPDEYRHAFYSALISTPPAYRYGVEERITKESRFGYYQDVDFNPKEVVAHLEASNNVKVKKGAVPPPQVKIDEGAMVRYFESLIVKLLEATRGVCAAVFDQDDVVAMQAPSSTKWREVDLSEFGAEAITTRDERSISSSSSSADSQSEIGKRKTSRPTLKDIFDPHAGHMRIYRRSCYKYHIHYPNFIVNVALATELNNLIVAKLSGKQTAAEKKVAPYQWSKVLDSAAYNAGLRMPYAPKLYKDGGMADAQSEHKRIFDNATHSTGVIMYDGLHLQYHRVVLRDLTDVHEPTESMFIPAHELRNIPYSGGHRDRPMPVHIRNDDGTYIPDLFAREYLSFGHTLIDRAMAIQEMRLASLHFRLVDELVWEHPRLEDDVLDIVGGGCSSGAGRNRNAPIRLTPTEMDKLVQPGLMNISAQKIQATIHSAIAALRTRFSAKAYDWENVNPAIHNVVRAENEAVSYWQVNLVGQNCPFTGKLHKRTQHSNTPTLFADINHETVDFKCWSCTVQDKDMEKRESVHIHRGSRTDQELETIEILTAVSKAIVHRGVNEQAQMCAAILCRQYAVDTFDGKEAHIGAKYVVWRFLYHEGRWGTDQNAFYHDLFNSNGLVARTITEVWATAKQYTRAKKQFTENYKELLATLTETSKINNSLMAQVFSLIRSYWIKTIGEKKVSFGKQLDQRPDIMVARTQTLQFFSDRKTEVRPGRPEDMATFSTTVDYVPWDELGQEYKDVALQVMKDCIPVDEERETYLKVFSRGLHGGRRLQQMGFIHGRGGEGKSFLHEKIYKPTFGEYVLLTKAALLQGRAEDMQGSQEQTMQLKSRRFAFLEELNKAIPIQLPTFKNLSADSVHNSRGHYASMEEFVMQASFWVICNDWPKFPVKFSDRNIWRRFWPFPFRQAFLESEEEIEENRHIYTHMRLRYTHSEIEYIERMAPKGILSLMVKYYDDNVHDISFEMAPSLTAIQAQLRSRNDHCKLFADSILSTRLEESGRDGVEHGLTYKELYEEFQHFVREGVYTNGMPMLIEDISEFIKEMGTYFKDAGIKMVKVPPAFQESMGLSGKPTLSGARSGCPPSPETEYENDIADMQDNNNNSSEADSIPDLITSDDEDDFLGPSQKRSTKRKRKSPAAPRQKILKEGDNIVEDIITKAENTRAQVCFTQRYMRRQNKFVPAADVYAYEQGLTQRDTAARHSAATAMGQLHLRN